MTVHSFEEKLAQSMEEEGDVRLAQTLATFFGRNDLVLDKIPREVAYQHDFNVVVDGINYKIEEKRNFQPYGGELIEFISRDKPTCTKGWAFKLVSDILVLSYPNRVSVLPARTFHKAFMEHRSAWWKKFAETRAKNQGYDTINRVIPISTLGCAVCLCGSESMCLCCYDNRGGRQIHLQCFKNCNMDCPHRLSICRKFHGSRMILKQSELEFPPA